ncbi:putative GNAT family N-acyltransferase [Pedobacter africanus]|uniref:GNAT family N-acyltransferase n=1 Tax=Pedobacter africanus TaxID=151894 RepID=A0ACC6KX72_9SPHI|nr:GNAT family N-acetyltransferase [Pedobacter africanus]MDR6783713.1 putative GNAT family N-acyltransferase [Pedobacter africanus]
MEILKYTPLFREKCIALFESNMPRFFAPEELPLFIDFLDNDIEDNYYVVEKNAEIVACGGIFLDRETDEAGLSWGMVHIAEHKNGIGKLLTVYRINLLKEIYPGKVYKVDTSQHTEGFYLKRGFQTIAVVPDGFAKGIDKYVMKMNLVGRKI